MRAAVAESSGASLVMGAIVGQFSESTRQASGWDAVCLGGVCLLGVLVWGAAFAAFWRFAEPR